MSCMHYFTLEKWSNFSKERVNTHGKWAVWALWVILLFPFPASGKTPEPQLVVNHFVSDSVLGKIVRIREANGPVLVLNPYVGPFPSDEIGPYRRIVPSPQVVFPATQKVFPKFP